VDGLSSFEVDSYDEVVEVNFTSLNKEFHRLSFEFYKRIEVLENKGIIIKDLDEGLIDFLSFIDNREVFLCWKAGEKSIEHFHEIHDGFTGRRSIKELSNVNDA